MVAYEACAWLIIEKLCGGRIRVVLRIDCHYCSKKLGCRQLVTTPKYKVVMASTLCAADLLQTAVLQMENYGG